MSWFWLSFLDFPFVILNSGQATFSPEFLVVHGHRYKASCPSKGFFKVPWGLFKAQKSTAWQSHPLYSLHQSDMEWGEEKCTCFRLTETPFFRLRSGWWPWVNSMLDQWTGVSHQTHLLIAKANLLWLPYHMAGGDGRKVIETEWNDVRDFAGVRWSCSFHFSLSFSLSFSFSLIFSPPSCLT